MVNVNNTVSGNVTPDNTDVKMENSNVLNSNNKGLLDADNMSKCMSEAIKPRDIKYDWKGYLWPIIKKAQYTYTQPENNKIRFALPAYLNKKQISLEHINNIKKLYVGVGWKDCIIECDWNRNTNIYITLTM